MGVARKYLQYNFDGEGKQKSMKNEKKKNRRKEIREKKKNEDRPRVFTRKFGEDQSKTLPMGLFFPKKIPGCGYNFIPE